MYTIRKKFHFEYAHQLYDSFTVDCKNQIHGHSGVVEVFLSSEELDDKGVVVDFTQIKSLIKDYINSWDHALIMSDKFPKEYLKMLKKYNKKLMIVNYNPTAENMAKIMFEDINGIFIRNNIGDILSKIRVHETETGYAEVR